MSSIGNWVDAATADSEQALANRVSGIGIRGEVTANQGAQKPTPATWNGSAGAATTGNDDNNDDDKEQTLAERSIIQKVLRSGLLRTSKAEIEVLRKNPSSTLYSTKSFEDMNLRPELLRAIYQMGFNAPSKIQEAALPYLLKDPPQNMIAQSQSGTGKTAAFVLALLMRVNVNQHFPQAVCLSPTYELALQTGAVIEQMAQFCPEIKISYCVRGVDDPCARGEQVKSHIVIGTPGKMTDWALRLHFLDLSKVRVFVLDEADVMIATQGYQDSSIKLHRKLPKTCQMMLFSATYNTEVLTFAETLIPDATIFRLTRDEESLDNIKQYYILCKSQEDKYQAIANIYGVITIGQAMIFCHTRQTANWLATKLVGDGHAVALLSGELTIEQRLDVLTRFRNGQERILITTNVMARGKEIPLNLEGIPSNLRGIDIDQVTLVVNYDLPIDVINHRPDCETYLHRIGRTGRFGKAGIAINLIDGERSFDNMKSIEEHFGKPIKKLDHENVAEIEEIEK